MVGPVKKELFFAASLRRRDIGRESKRKRKTETETETKKIDSDNRQRDSFSLIFTESILSIFTLQIPLDQNHINREESLGWERGINDNRVLRAPKLELLYEDVSQKY